jgi:hypothetical protein
MRNPSLRQNLAVILCLYAGAFVVAAAFPLFDSGQGGSPSVIAAVSGEKPALKSTSIKTGSAEKRSASPYAGDDEAKPPFDPIKANGPVFTGWTKPKLAIVVSGHQDGYFEPCGCAGIENQKGGMSRRFAMIKDLKAKGWPVIGIDVGGLVRRYGKQAELQFAISAEALKTMDYRAVGFGAEDLRLSAGEVAAAVAGDEPEHSIFVSANVKLLDVDELVPKFRIVEIGGYKIGITSVIGEQDAKKINSSEVSVSPAEQALKAVLPELKGCDVRILLAHTSMEESKQLAAAFPTFDYVVTAGGPPEPPADPIRIEGSKQRLIEVGQKGQFVTVVGLYGKEKPVKFQRVPLDSRFGESPEMKMLLTQYQDQLQQLGWSGLGIKPMKHPRTLAAKGKDPLEGQFAGALSCKECHPTAYGIWSKTKHAHATETLTKLDPPRQYDAECISCHSTGWDPQGYFPYVSGFDSLETTAKLVGNSCENCHGPGAAHIAAEKGKVAAKRATQRTAMQLTAGLAKANICGDCHDHDNSPDFDFEKYWPKVQHQGKR